MKSKEEIEKLIIRINLSDEKDINEDLKWDIIDTLNQALEQSSEWISVEDRLPKESGFYQCYIEELNDLGLSKYVYQLTFTKEKEFNNWSLNGEIIIGVKCYQPLPQPPKKD